MRSDLVGLNVLDAFCPEIESNHKHDRSRVEDMANEDQAKALK